MVTTPVRPAVVVPGSDCHLSTCWRHRRQQRRGPEGRDEE
jgi:hypothetical protein